MASKTFAAQDAARYIQGMITGTFAAHLVALTLITVPVNIFGPQDKPYIAPDRTFSINIPREWQLQPPTPAQPHTVTLGGPAKYGSGVLTITHIGVRAGAKAASLLRRRLAKPLGQLPRFEVIQRRKIALGTLRGPSVLARYAFQGNLQFPRLIEESIVVVGQDAYIFHFDGFAAAAPNYVPDLEAIYGSFLPRPAAALPDPYRESDKPLQDIERIPF